MKGKVWKFGNDIDTDIILPGRYLIYTDEEKLSEHCMEGLVLDFLFKLRVYLFLFLVFLFKIID